MTCRKPTIAVRQEVLERLARANADPPASEDFAPISWSELDRTSLTAGLEDLQAYQRERVQAEEQRRIAEAHERAQKRERQRELARKWEAELIDKSRQRDFRRRIAEARRRAQEQADDELSGRRTEWNTRLQEQALEQTWEREMAAGTVAHSKKLWGRGVQALVAAVALTAVIWGSMLGQAQSDSESQLGELWEDKQAQEMAAVTRVAELEAEIERRMNMSESERAWLESELAQARVELAEAEKEREAIDRRRPRPQPRRMARTIEPVDDAQATEKDAAVQASSSEDSVRMAVDEAHDDGCLPYDPLCFEL